MKNIILKSLGALLIAGSLTSCGSEFLKTEMSNGVDVNTALNSVANVGNALNGTYYQFFRYYFAGNYGTVIGDLASDIVYWNGQTSHEDDIYQFTYQSTGLSSLYIWTYGYKVVDHSSRVIKASKTLKESLSGEDLQELNIYTAEAYALRAYSNFVMANVFCHQVKVDGKDFSDNLGLVVVDEPVEAFADVTRSTVGETYSAILSDIKNAISLFEANGDRVSLFYFNLAAAYGLAARVSLYLENYDDANSYAQKAIAESGIETLTYTPEGYKSLYNYGASNTESMFALAITTTDNWSANSCGTLFSTYDYSPSPWLLSILGEKDVRNSIMVFAENSTDEVPEFGGGKFACFGMGNPAYATNYLINAPEMFLIQAEANIRKATPDLEAAREALLVVAKRNLDITKVEDLPATKDELLSFLRDESARELFQEGHRLFDIRRWGVKGNAYAFNAPNIDFTFKDVDLSNVIFPIPDDEINAGFGVEQTPGWADGRPQ
ncbi:MAG: RagB/SusD family nutrient uptake outer membrane protein [Muribaculaceae bacterium]|nr:RagB/SusD family nutrient uptake outer membrane protein [Muribaculaceae bacterium]